MHDTWTSPELDSLLGQRSLTRRQVLVTSLATGFARAVQPAGAQTITTDTTGLTVGEVTIPGGWRDPRVSRDAAGWAARLAWFRQHGVG